MGQTDFTVIGGDDREGNKSLAITGHNTMQTYFLSKI